MRTPAPLPTALGASFWEGLRQGRILLQHCSDCDRWIFYPRPLCPYCLGRRPTWRPVEGAATLYSFTVAEKPLSADFPVTPWMPAIVKFAEGIRLPSALVDVAPDDIRIGMPLAPSIRIHDEAHMPLLYFAPAPEAHR